MQSKLNPKEPRHVQSMLSLENNNKKNVSKCLQKQLQFHRYLLVNESIYLSRRYELAFKLPKDSGFFFLAAVQNKRANANK